jgi:hypothetical protein
MKSFYNVSWAQGNGGYSYDFTYGTLLELQQALDFEFGKDMWGACREVASGHEIPLCVFIRGRCEKRINLTAYITIRQRASGAEYALKDQIDWKNVVRNYTGLVEVDRAPWEAYWAFFESAVPYIDWGAVPLIPLEEPVLEEGEEAEYEDEYDGMTYQASFSYGLSGETDNDKFRTEMDQALAIDSDWLSFNAGAVRALAESMHATGDFSGMPVLADALQEAGCGNELLLWHCRAPARVHARGSWLVELLRKS